MGFDRGIAFLVGVLVGLQPFALPLNLAIVDILIVYLMLVWGTHLHTLSGGAMGTFRACIPWLWLIAVGSVAGMFATVHLGDSALQLSRDFYALAIFFGVLAWLLLKPSSWRPMFAGLLVVACACAVLALVESDLRSSGTFLNPNYAGHFMAMTMILIVAVRSSIPRWCLLLLPLMLAGVLRTASFGGLVMLAGGAFVLVWMGAGRFSSGTRLLTRTLLVASVALIALSGTVIGALEANEAADTGLNENRLERSSSGRLERWQVGLQLAAEHPFGLGPGGAKFEEAALGDRELHNDPLAYLVERSALGLIGLLGYLMVLWRRMPRGGAARIVLGVVVLGSLVRETLNYRHVWVILALALVIDWQREQSLRVPVPEVITSKAEEPA